MGQGKEAEIVAICISLELWGCRWGYGPVPYISGFFCISTPIGVLLGLVSSRVRNTQHYVDY